MNEKRKKGRLSAYPKERIQTVVILVRQLIAILSEELDRRVPINHSPRRGAIGADIT
jgi:hypothetical protein